MIQHQNCCWTWISSASLPSIRVRNGKDLHGLKLCIDSTPKLLLDMDFCCITAINQGKDGKNLHRLNLCIDSTPKLLLDMDFCCITAINQGEKKD
jgi:hypothetical protein